MAIPNETRATRHLKSFALYHLAALRADPASEHLVAATDTALNELLAALAKREAAELVELNQQALFTRKDFDLDELTRVVELGVLAASAKDRGSAGYRAAFPRGLSVLLGLRGKSQENSTLELTAVLRQRFAEIATAHASQLEELAKSAAQAEDAWKTSERAARVAFTEEQIARSELVRQLHSNRGALRALYPRNTRRVASYFPPSHSRAAAEADVADDDDVPTEPRQ
jgi:hypothetical protein